ncbi:winged helix DNA-binding protein [Nonomuraea sp. NBC_00507]
MDRDVVAAIDELAGQGFVERTPDPDDRRRNMVTLTTAGERQRRPQPTHGKYEPSTMAGAAPGGGQSVPRAAAK